MRTIPDGNGTTTLPPKPVTKVSFPFLSNRSDITTTHQAVKSAALNGAAAHGGPASRGIGNGQHSKRVDKGAKYSIEDVSSFPIANAAVTDVRRSLKNTIQLDTNIQIKLDFINPESAEKFVEKGWDEEKQMYYYLVYFNKEQKS